MSLHENYKPFKIIILKHSRHKADKSYEIHKIYVFVGHT